MESENKKARKQSKNLGLDLLKTCRTCMNRSSKMNCLFTTKGRDLCEELLFCTGLEAKEGDGLPSKMCNACVNKMQLAHKFKSRCLASDTLFKKHFQPIVKTEFFNYNDMIRNDKQIMECDDHITQYDDPITDTVPDITRADKVEIKIEVAEVDQDIPYDSTTENDDNPVKKEKPIHNFGVNLTYNDDFHVDPIKVIDGVNENEKVDALNNIKNEVKPQYSDQCVVLKNRPHGSRGPYRKRIRRPGSTSDSPKAVKFRRLYCEPCDLRFETKEESQAHRRDVHKDAERWTCEYCGKKGDKRMTYYTHRRRHELKMEAESAKNPTEADPKPDEAAPTVSGDDDDGYVDEFDILFKNNVIPVKVKSATRRSDTRVTNFGEVVTNCGDGPKSEQTLALNKDAALKRNRVRRPPGAKRVRKKRPKLNRCFCEQCGVRFHSLEQFLAHKRDIHHYNYLCEICGKMSHNRSGHYAHRLVHETPTLACDLCDYKTSRKYDLVTHMKMHSGIKSYMCDSCPASFCTISNLNKHRRRHEAERRGHACARCGKRYLDKRACDAHAAAHAGGNNQTYYCKICGVSFYRHHRLSKHMRDHHQVETPRQRPGRRRMDAALQAADSP